MHKVTLAKAPVPVSLYRGKHREWDCNDGGMSMSAVYLRMFARMVYRSGNPFCVVRGNN